MAKVIMLWGLPASGKSTWAKSHVANNSNWVRVNKDDIRLELGNGFKNVYAKEKATIKRERELIKQYLGDGKNIVIDNTHLNPKTLGATERYVRECGCDDIAIRTFNISVEEAIKRDKERVASVGEHVIRMMYNKWIKDKE